jgi:ABC-type polysaccharide/polyol phosphate transport system ATPase subunit
MASIDLKNVTLEYEIFHDRVSSLKEAMINLFHSRKYVESKTSKFCALKELNLSIKEGERLGIIGINGAGKSTLLKVIAKIIKPQKGSIKVDGFVQPLIEIGAGFNPELTGIDNIYLNSYMLGFSTAQIRSKVQEIIEFSEIGQFIDVPIKYYSTGMTMRLAFTIATLIEPEILLFDEMLSTGDAAFLVKAKAKIDAIVTKAKIIVLVSHDLDLVQKFCNRVLVMKNGGIAFDGPASLAVEYYLNSLQ